MKPSKLRVFGSILKGRVRLVFLVPKASNVVVFGKNYADEFSELLPNYSKILFDQTYSEVIYVKSLFLGALDWTFRGSGSLTQFYFLRLLREARPKLVLTSEFIGDEIFILREHLANDQTLSFVVFQRGYMDESWLPLMQKLTKDDLIFSLDEESKKLWSSGAQESKVIAASTLRSKILLGPMPKFARNQGFQIGYVSQWRKEMQDFTSSFYELEDLYLSKLVQAVNLAGFKLIILGAATKPDQVNEEFHFFDKRIGTESSWGFSSRKTPLGTYEAIPTLPLLISAGSTMGWEALANGIRTVFFVCNPSSAFTLQNGYVHRQVVGPAPTEFDQPNPLMLRAEDSTIKLSKQLEECLSYTPAEFMQIAQKIVGVEAINTDFETIQKLVMQKLA